jgi:hypothetical protein
VSLEAKIEHAQRCISTVLSRYHNPIAMSSFGKDSMVLLDLLKRLEVKLPILFHREPSSPKKYAFANRIIEEEGYVCHDYPPSLTQIVKSGDDMQIVSHYQVGPKAFTWFPNRIAPFVDGEPFLCGYRDMYMRPLGTFSYPWDVAFVGHKSSDTDLILGAVPLAVDIRPTEGGCDFAYPLRYFTDADIWKYIERFSVPYNDRRYDPANGYKEYADITYNDDQFRACVRCMDRDQPAAVFCPLMGLEVGNISGSLRSVEREKRA